MITLAIRNIFKTNLGVKKADKCLVFCDRLSPGEVVDSVEEERRTRLSCMALITSEVGRGIAGDVVMHEFEATGNHGAEPPADLWEKAFGKRAVHVLRRKGLLGPIIAKTAGAAELAAAEKVLAGHRDDAVDAVIALSNYSTSHTQFRDFLTRICGARYASMPLFDMSMLEGPMAVDWAALASLTRKTARRLNQADAVEIATENGTKVSFSVRGRKAEADTGLLRKPGSFGNLPAGEAFVAPVEGSARGRLVLEWSPTRRLSSPVTLTVRDGAVQGVSGNDEFAGRLKQQLNARQENRNIAELGIGTNSRARRPDNILESEKILGTIHIALGDNSTFGGKVKTPFHQDFVFFKPTVVLVLHDGSKDVLMKKGKLKVIS